MRDPYEVLGVSRKATADEIKKSFRKLAKKHHPDSNKDPKAAARFSEINTAYEILGDENKRRAFDAGEIDAEGKPKGFSFDPRQQGGFDPGSFRQGPGGETIFETFTYGPGGFQRRATRGGARPQPGGGFEDILSSIFGGRAAPHGDTAFEEFETAQAKGTDIALSLTVSLEESVAGTKKRVMLPSGKEVEVSIPAGVTDGRQIRLRGQGFAGPIPGDAIVTIRVAAHPELKPDGADLRADVSVPLEDAILGGSVRVPTLTGAVDLKIPPKTSGGRVFRLKGKGLPSKGAEPGDLLVSINILLPEGADAELEALAKKLKGS